MAQIVRVAESKKKVVSGSYANEIRAKIQSSMPEVYITRVEVVRNNKFLHAAYQLRKAQYVLSRRRQCPTEDLYHATAEGNVQSILKNNLDWRRVTRSRFGAGVSFSHSPSYANKFCNEKNGSKRAFIICEVLTGNELRVACNYSPYPKKNIDTYRSKSNMVVVKFEDNSFYPKCVVYYQTTCPAPQRPLRNYVELEDNDDDFIDYVVSHVMSKLQSFRF